MLERIPDLVGVALVEYGYQNRTLVANFVLVRIFKRQFPCETGVIRDIKIAVGVFAQVISSISDTHDDAWCGA